METENKNIGNNAEQPRYSGNDFEYKYRRERIVTGAFIAIIGGLFLAKRVGAELPHWIFSWPMIPVAVGLYIGVRHAFKNWAWLIPFSIGVVLLIQREMDMELTQYFWPVLVIAIGVGMMIKPRRRKRDGWSHEQWQKHGDAWKASDAPTEHVEGDYIDSVSIFGSSKKNILSKNFRGGDTVCFFGGTEINMSQADITGPVKLDVVQLFGGTKLIVPPHWRVQTEDMVSIFGGIDDKRRPVAGQVYDPSKVLIFEGTCIFGGIEIKSY